ncbi:MAG: hypothetical protein DMF37_02685 [Verrucomicrobia bacterium]|nr:MAG: hypothetical protein DMF37_02685 [Verrucomicrobiota bacterium]
MQDGLNSFLKPLHRCIKDRRDHANQRLKSKRTRLMPHSLQVARTCPVLLEPVLVLSWSGRSPEVRGRRMQLFPDYFYEFFRKTIGRQQHPTDPTLGGFAQYLSLLF